MVEEPADRATDGAPEPTAAAGEPLAQHEYPLLAIGKAVLFPGTGAAVTLSSEASVRLVAEHGAGDQPVVVAALRSTEGEQGERTDGEEAALLERVYGVGVLAEIRQVVRLPGGAVRIFVVGTARVRLLALTQEEPYPVVLTESLPPADAVDDVPTRALQAAVVDQFRDLVQLVPYLPDEMVEYALGLERPGEVAYFAASNTRLSVAAKQELLEMDDVRPMLERLSAALREELEVERVRAEISGRVRGELAQSQREALLRQQLRAIQEELGETDPQQQELARLGELVEVSAMSDEARQEAERQLKRLESLPSAAPDAAVIKTYLEVLTGLPWSAEEAPRIDLVEARRVLDADHYGLDDVKDRLVEHLAVTKRRAQAGVRDGARAREPILCFIGPPGVGKTSLGQSIARALSRKFDRFSLGGISDEAEIRGHRRTYVGALPGRIIQTIRRAGSRTLVMMLDEIDKVGQSWRGDPTSALLEVLDPEQNSTFRDNYLEVAFDLSQVFFITTANNADTIPGPLLDRMEVIELAGYTEKEKLEIAKRHLVPDQLAAHALSEQDVGISDEALSAIAREYTREAGVRNLDRLVGRLARKSVISLAQGAARPLWIDREKAREFLGRPRYYDEAAERLDRPGVAVGLVWTPVGGDIIFVEAAKMPGSGKLTLTGQLRDVMRESAEAALSYVRSRADELGIDRGFFDFADIHIHVPAGAVPKDGPSAGVTMAVALVSLLTGRPVNSSLAMTGEITLRGKVLPVGGIKEKVLGAARAGLTTVILPARNEADLEEIPEETRQAMRFVLAGDMQAVVEAALGAPSTATNA